MGDPRKTHKHKYTVLREKGREGRNSAGTRGPKNEKLGERKEAGLRLKN